MALKYILFCFFLILNLIFVSAALDLEIEKIDKGAVVISELNNPAKYEFVINNKGESDNVEIYSLVGVSFSQKGTFALPSGITKVEIEAHLSDDLRKRQGDYSIEYQIKGNQGILKDRLPIRVVSLNDVFLVNGRNIHPNDNMAEIIVTNRVNTKLDNVKVSVKSIFFDSSEEINLEPYGEANFSVEIDRSKTSGLIAGPYVMSSDIEIDENKIEMEGLVNYLEKEGTSVSRKSSGFLIKETSITKTNEGNVPVTAKIEMKKDIISRLFTTYSINPITSDRQGLLVNYVWEKNIRPGESFSVFSRTNYTFPFVVIILVILIVLLVKFYSLKALSVKKGVTLVRTKGGEFALKGILHVKARKDIENIEIIDRLPSMTKLYERYGRKPDKIDESTRRLFWNVSKMSRGESRVFSYVIYSKVRAVGRFELPAASATFEFDGKRESILSNKAYFVSETVVEEP